MTAPRLLLALGLLSLGACRPLVAPVSGATVRAGDLPADPAALATRLESLFDPRDPVALENSLVVADRLLELDPKSYAAAWQAARSCFWLADAAEGDEKKDRRAWFADRGAKYAERAIAINDKGVEGQYYRGLDLGYLARTRTVGALELVKDIHKAALAAVAADEKYDHAGPLRLLGGVLISAPGWPTSVGDPDDGAEQLAKAVALDPGYPLNQLYYGEALLKTDKPMDAERALLEAERLAQVPEYAWMNPRLRTQADELIAKARGKMR